MEHVRGHDKCASSDSWRGGSWLCYQRLLRCLCGYQRHRQCDQLSGFRGADKHTRQVLQGAPGALGAWLPALRRGDGDDPAAAVHRLNQKPTNRPRQFPLAFARRNIGHYPAMGEVYTGTKSCTVFARRAVSGDERLGELLKWCRRWAALGLVGDTVGNLSFRTVNGFIINRTAG